MGSNSSSLKIKGNVDLREIIVKDLIRLFQVKSSIISSHPKKEGNRLNAEFYLICFVITS
jgi:hypothetical protein